MKWFFALAFVMLCASAADTESPPRKMQAVDSEFCRNDSLIVIVGSEARVVPREWAACGESVKRNRKSHPQHS